MRPREGHIGITPEGLELSLHNLGLGTASLRLDRLVQTKSRPATLLLPLEIIQQSEYMSIVQYC